MRTWTAGARIDGGTREVLDVLCDPEACARWSPIPFELTALDGDRLEDGTRARVQSRFGSLCAGMDVEVREASEDGLWLRAHGPIELDVRYELYDDGEGSEVVASISLHRARGLRGAAMAHATDAVAPGLLRRAVAGIAREVEARSACALAA